MERIIMDEFNVRETGHAMGGLRYATNFSKANAGQISGFDAGNLLRFAFNLRRILDLHDGTFSNKDLWNVIYSKTERVGTALASLAWQKIKGDIE
jgi:hypothetical protein